MAERHFLLSGDGLVLQDMNFKPDSVAEKHPSNLDTLRLIESVSGCEIPSEPLKPAENYEPDITNKIQLDIESLISL